MIGKLIKLRKEHPDLFWKKIRNAIRIRCMYLIVAFSFCFHKRSLNDEQTERITDWKWYVYLRRKFGRFLRRLPEVPVPSDTAIPKVIWWCWLQGEDNAPALCRACLNSLRRHMSDYEIKIITEQNMWGFIHVPDFIRDKYERGIIPRTQFSDLLRTCLLIEHGGIWMDSTVLCTGGIPSSLFDRHLFIYQNYKRGDESKCLSTWLIAACRNEPGLVLTRELLFEYWRRSNFLCHYYLYHFFFTMVCGLHPEILAVVPRYSNIPPHILQFEQFSQFSPVRWEQIKGMSAFHKLSWKYDTSAMDLTGTYYEHVLEEYGV